MLYRIVSSLAFILCKILFRLEAKGRDNIPKSGGFILAGNHSSYLDPVVLAAMCPRQLNFMARHDLFTIPIFGPFIRSLGAFPLRRGFVDITSIKEGLRCLKQGGVLLIFPGGGRSFNELDGRFEPGIGFIATKSLVPVIPAFIKGAQRAFGRGAWLIRPIKIRVYFGKPIYPKDKEFKDGYRDFTNRVMQEIKQLSQEVERGGYRNAQRRKP